MFIKEHKIITNEELEFASLIWNFLHIKEQIQNADLILVLCSHDLRVAEHAINLYKSRFANRILFSGGLNFFTKNIFKNSEAETFANLAIKAGIPGNNIFIENRSTNTGENILYSKSLLNSYNFYPKSIIAVQKPSMTLRVKLALDKQWNGPNFYISSPSYSFLDAPHTHINIFMVINEIVGDLQRIIKYPDLGFQSKTTIPENIIHALTYLISNGYNLHLC